ncbi:MAG: phosphate ABC transporter, permease protein PstA, partial [Candidatus Parcubacteria bacterium]|nr:phosphate ABC transporter, permease protein PstA [Burkholderiales bacterium]
MSEPAAAQAAQIDLPLERQLFEGRSLTSGILSAIVWLMAFIASIPLLSVLYMLVVKGGSRLSWEALSSLPPAGFETGGGFGNAIVGT